MILPAILLFTLALPQDAPAQDAPDAPPATEPEEAAPAAPEAPAAPSASPAEAQVDIDAGLALFRKRRFKQAETEFEKAVGADPGSAAANFYLGYTVYKIAEPKRPNDPGKRRAAELFAKAYDLDPAFRPVWAGPKK
jgi:tetratricopeptide (TPR) repeat protein